jgi:AAA+ ATPase superfamily predicted ATPase
MGTYKKECGLTNEEIELEKLVDAVRSEPSTLLCIKILERGFKEKIINILKNHSSFYNLMELAVSEELFTDVADAIVRSLATPAVSKSEGLQGRELLLAFRDHLSKKFDKGSAFTLNDIADFLSQQ